MQLSWCWTASAWHANTQPQHRSSAAQTWINLLTVLTGVLLLLLLLLLQSAMSTASRSTRSV
jgi:hypothetical protein